MSALSSRLRPQQLSRRSGFVLPLAACMFIVAIPIAGLVIDVGAFYMIQSRLQQAVDAGALAGVRSLARGVTSGAQSLAAQNTADAYAHANFPTGYMGSSNLSIPTPTVDLSNSYFRTVTVTASVNAPHLFMRWFGNTFTSINARALATRRDVNVMLVMDRSDSLDLSSSCNPLKNAAIDFVNKFSEGRDYVGLTTFATSYSTPVALSQTFTTNMTNAITNMICEGSTNSASGLWLGYQGLATLNQPGALNVILFFTDGMPTSVTANFAIKASSTCSNKTARDGVITASGSSIRGLMSTTPGNPILQGSQDAVAVPNSTNCAYAGSWPNNRGNVGNDITGIPLSDVFGNSLTFNYNAVTTSGSPSMIAATSNTTNANNLIAAVENAAVSAAVRIRQPASPGNGSAALSNVVIFGIGLGGSGSASDAFMNRVTNDPSGANFDNTHPAGMYVYANDASELAAAFNRIASEILRLAQ